MSDSDEFKNCRQCGEQIKASARKCRYCGEFLSKELRDAQREARRPPKIPTLFKVWGALVLFVGGAGALSGFVLTRITRQSGDVYVGWLQVAVFLGVARVGVGLIRGKKAAVVGLFLFTGLGCLATFNALLADAQAGLILLGLMLVLCGPPIVMGLKHWQTLK